MSELKQGGVSEEIDNLLGPNINGSGELTVFPKGKFLSFNYDPAGGGEVLYRINGVGEMQKLPSGGWFNFGQTDSVVFNYSAPHPGDDIKLFWNVS